MIWGYHYFRKHEYVNYQIIIPSNLEIWWGQFFGVWILNEGKHVRHAWTDVIFLVSQESSFLLKYNLRHVDEGRFGYIIGTPF